MIPPLDRETLQAVLQKWGDYGDDEFEEWIYFQIAQLATPAASPRVETEPDWQAIAREWQAKYYEALRSSTVPMPPLGPPGPR